MKKKMIGIFVCMLVIFAVVLPTISAMNVHTSGFEKDSSESFFGNPTNFQGLITIKIVAHVAYVDDRYNLLGGVIKVNDTITGKYTYDSGTPDTNTISTVGDYWHTSSSCGIELEAGGLIFKTNPGNVNFLIEICDDHGSPTPRDNYLVRSYNNLQCTNGMLVDHIAWQLDDDSCTALASPSLPTTAPVLTDWESIFGLTIEGSDPSDELKDYFIRAHVIKATKHKAINIVGDGDIQDTLFVNVPSEYQSPFMQFILKIQKQIPHAFPLLRHLMGY